MRRYPRAANSATSRPVPQAGSSSLRTGKGQYLRQAASIKSASAGVSERKARS